MVRAFPRLVIAAPQSGSGKTTVTLGVLLALRRAGLTTQPFKVGPDFIDPSHHTAICARPSRNLDTWLCEDAVVREVFTRASSDAEISIIEGVMGLYDGYGPNDERGSTAHLARLLEAPVLIVIDAQRMAASAAAVALGLQQFDRALDIAGVIFNQVGSDEHYVLLKTALETHTGLRCFGYVGLHPEFALEERHLGLVPAAETPPGMRSREQLLHEIERHVDIAGLVAAARRAPPLEEKATGTFSARESRGLVRIAVAQDQAFNFYYPENLDLLRAAGADIVPFSVLNDGALPTHVNGIYLGGGFPEVFAEALAANRSMIAGIRAFHDAGGAIYAECGGLMTLCEALVDFAGRRHEMVGLVPATTIMRRDRLAIGYVEAEPLRDSVLADRGIPYRGHTFHYSVLADPRFEPALRLRHGGKISYEGYASGNLFATYVHAHFAGSPRLAQRFVDCCRSRGTPGAI